jgi:hypothetical protein
MSENGVAMKTITLPTLLVLSLFGTPSLLQASDCSLPADIKVGEQAIFHVGSAPNGVLRGKLLQVDARICWAKILVTSGAGEIWLNLRVLDYVQKEKRMD